MSRTGHTKALITSVTVCFGLAKLIDRKLVGLCKIDIKKIEEICAGGDEQNANSPSPFYCNLTLVLCVVSAAVHGRGILAYIKLYKFKLLRYVIELPIRSCSTYVHFVLDEVNNLQ